MDGGMDDNPNISAEGADTTPEGNTHSLPPNDLSARYQFFYNDISRYCNDMWAIIASVRHRAVEHVIFSASLLGLYLAFDAASDYYKISWWGFTAILVLVAATLPHLRLVVDFTEVEERHLDIAHLHDPLGKPESASIKALEDKAEILHKKSTQSGSRYIFARGLWFLGAAIGTALTAIEWFV